MILKLRTKKGTWKIIDGIKQIDYHHLENSKEIKINIFYNDKNATVEEIVADYRMVYILNNEGKTIERV